MSGWGYTLGNISSVKPASLPWPLTVQGRDVWRSAVLAEWEEPWFWHCQCGEWIRGVSADKCADSAIEHLRGAHE